MFLARFLIRNLKGYRHLVAIAIVLTLAEVGADIFSAFPLKFILDKLVNHRDPSFPGADTLLGLFSRFGEPGGTIVFSITLIIVLGLLSAAFKYFQLFLVAFIAKNLTVRLSKRLFDRLQRLSMSWHGKQKAGDLVQRITGIMADLEKFVADGMVDLVTGVLTIVGVIVVMLVTSFQFTLLSIIIVPILIAIVFFYTRKIRITTKEEKRAEGEVSGLATEAMEKVMEIKAFTLEGFMYDLFKDLANRRSAYGARVGRLQAQFSPFVDIALIAGTAIIVGVGAYAAADPDHAHQLGLLTIPANAVTFGTLTVFLAYLAKLYQPIRDLAKLTTLASSASSTAERIEDVLKQEPEDLTVPPHYKPPRIKGTIIYENVHFCYDFNKPDHMLTERDMVLKGVSLDIPAGKTVALVGLSGSGKTTLTNLLPRFYEIRQNSGVIKIDGVDVCEYPLVVLRQNIGIVSQKPILFEGTIRENIKIGRPEASDADMEKAAELACIHETIEKKLGGYDRKITGRDLSGGQTQRIAIARAILRNAPIVIMDEPTAALDAEAEAEVMSALEGLVQRRTVIMITHRLSTVGKVDEIIVLGDGSIVEQGTFRQLIEKEGAFAHLWKAQHPPIIDPEASKSIIKSHEGSKSFIRTGFASSQPLSPKAHVVIWVDGRIIGTYQLDKEVLTVGRITGSDVQVLSQHVSRLHATILWKNGVWIIKDASSLNGLRYNGNLVDERALMDGDRISLAPSVLLEYEEERVSPSPAPSPQVQPKVQVPPQLLPKAQVVIEVDGSVVATRQLDKEKLSVGRLQANNIHISSRYVSAVHATILWEHGAWSIQDEDSANGLTYQGKKVKRHTFANGDRISLGPTVALRYEKFP